MELFSEVNQSLKKELLREYSDQKIEPNFSSAEKISQELRRIISIDDLRSSGSFFTGDDLASLAINKILSSTDNNSVFFDPTCGVGNLLIAASKLLPVDTTLEKTIHQWNSRLFGFDLHKEFVECTKLRLVQSAISRGAKSSTEYLSNLDKILPNIRVGDILQNLETCQKVTHVLLNPPYTLQIPLNKRSWSSGTLTNQEEEELNRLNVLRIAEINLIESSEARAMKGELDEQEKILDKIEKQIHGI